MLRKGNATKSKPPVQIQLHPASNKYRNVPYITRYHCININNNLP